jgi:Flp pilus assembly protein TadG
MLRWITPPGRLIGQFLYGQRGRQGATALEFALVGPLFMYLLAGIVEVSLMFFTTTVMDGAVQDAARKIRTGQAQLSGDALTVFQDELCDSLYTYDCDDVILDVKSYDSVSSVVISSIELNADGDLVDENSDPFNTQFTAGGSGEITVARVIYTWDFITPLIGELLGDVGGIKLLTSTAVFRNEPFE